MEGLRGLRSAAIPSTPLFGSSTPRPEPDRKSLSELEDEDLDVLVEETLGNWRRAEEPGPTEVEES